jgi:DNA-binding CsgD family transcriptional regulator
MVAGPRAGSPKWGVPDGSPCVYGSGVGITAPPAARTLDAVEQICRRTDSADDLLEALAGELHRAVPHEAAAWFGVDPVTMLAAAPSRVENLDPDRCSQYWHLEFHEQDFASFTDLARGDGVSALRLSLDDRPARSVRYREFMAPQGYEDELRATFRLGESVWGFVDLYRDSVTQPFTADEVALVRSISGVVAAALRSYVRAGSPWLGQPSAPGLLVLDRDGRAVSQNAEAELWLRDLWPCTAGSCVEPTTSLDLLDLRDCSMAVPTPLFALAARARAVAEGRERVPARLRLRDSRGRWLVLHASALAGRDEPSAGTVAIVIEAAKSAEVAPIVIEAYSLTNRERDVLGAIARGGSTTEIAAELFLSPHTVRDYVKTVFEKVGVSSRNELVAKLFGEHYADRLHETMTELH